MLREISLGVFMKTYVTSLFFYRILMIHFHLLSKFNMEPDDGFQKKSAFPELISVKPC